MTAEQITTVVTSVLEGGGIVVFLYYYIKGLKSRIASLEGTIQAQEKTLSVMEKRITETEKIGDIYRNLISDLPKDLENYKAVISQTKDNVIVELQNINKEKDAEIKRLREAEKQLEQLPRVEVEKRHMVRAVIFLNQKPNEEFSQFINAIEENQEAVVSHLIRAKDLTELIEGMGGSLKIESDPNAMKPLWMGADGRPIPDLRVISWGITGSFAVFVDKRVIMDTRKYTFLDTGLNRLREFIHS
jgi:uncharacterized coiled-coil protein SlyX